MKINSNICFTELLFCLKKIHFSLPPKWVKDGFNCFTIKVVEDFLLNTSFGLMADAKVTLKLQRALKLTWSDFLLKSPTFASSMGKAQPVMTSPSLGWALTPVQSSTGNLCCTSLQQCQHMDAVFHS